jgi:ADP-ribosyl-[dinitrogen reductase] hydrolase
VPALDHDRAIGALVGSAVGDALGAPFEFGPPGQFSARFSTSRGAVNEMIGGGGCGWAPGEFTDDTQMAIVLGESLAEHGELNGADVFARFRAWATTAKDVGSQTRAVLRDGDWQRSAAKHFERTGRAAGNGSLMRATSSALFAAGRDAVSSMALAMAQSALTHGDPAAGCGAALYHGMVRAAVTGESALDALPDLLARVPTPHRERYRSMLMSDSQIAGELPNSTVWTCLAEAVRVLRRSKSFEDAMRLACDVAGDVDTVACVAGGLAGATFGIQAIPTRWTSVLHGTVERRVYRVGDVESLALKLVSGRPTQS